MRRIVAVHTISHRFCRMQVFDEVHAGWRVVLYPPSGVGSPPEIFRASAPDGLSALLAAARGRADVLTEGVSVPPDVAK